MIYTAKSVDKAPAFDCNWDGEAWAGAQVAELKNARPEGSDHKPRVQAKLIHDKEALYGMFQVNDRYVKSVHTHYQDSVCTDSCVEFFFKPIQGGGYFNLEMNAGGTFLLYYVEDNTENPDGSYRKMAMVAPEHAAHVVIKTTLPPVVSPEITEPVTWRCQFKMPRATFEPYCGPVGDLAQQTWRCNFYKCGDNTSHPHWLSWAPVYKLNFHLPECFMPLVLED